MTKVKEIEIVIEIIENNLEGFLEIPEYDEVVDIFRPKKLVGWLRDYKRLLERESCEDAISRYDALMCLTGEYLDDKQYNPEDIISRHIRRIKALPPVQPKQKTGHWIKPNKKGCVTYGSSYAECDVCHEVQSLGWGMEYCPNCGASMDVEADSEVTK